jgi:transaldolase
MKFFVDGADIHEIESLAAMGLVDGVTTNPSIIAKTNRNIHEVLEAVCEIISGPVSAEVVSEEAEGMLREAGSLAKIAPNVTIKVPMTEEGIKACYRLRERDVMVNVTLCFSASQALIAAKAGATFVSPFVGRLDDLGHDGLNVVDEIVTLFSQDPHITTEVLVASVRHPMHIISAGQLGAHVVTAPAHVYRQMFKHPLTDIGLKKFRKDWYESGQNI